MLAENYTLELQYYKLIDYIFPILESSSHVINYCISEHKECTLISAGQIQENMFLACLSIYSGKQSSSTLHKQRALLYNSKLAVNTRNKNRQDISKVL